MNAIRCLGILLVCVVVCVSLAAGCRSEDSSRITSGAEVHATTGATPMAMQSGGGGANSSDRQAAETHPAGPPIDCPLRKQGIDVSHLRPFEDVEKYIAFLDRADRAEWQKPDEVVAALGLKGTETVVDLGAGSGYFTFRLAKALPSGKVVAADTEPEMIRHIHHKAMTEGVRNIEVKLIQPADPAIPANADLVFVCDVLHHVADRSDWLGRLAAEMMPGSRLVLIEFKEGNLPEGPPESAKIPRAQMLELVTKAGFTLTAERADLLPYQNFLVFRKPS